MILGWVSGRIYILLLGGPNAILVVERPIREFEPVMEVYNSWNADTRLNMFMLKKTSLAATLAPRVRVRLDSFCGIQDRS
jgi:hypothetical protein